jgi:adenosine deaminase
VTRAGDRLHVRGDAFADWQELLPMISPLAVLVAFLINEGRGPKPGSDPRRYLSAELGDTALIFPRQPELQEVIERDGLNEIHMHLNGSTELDVIWPDTVRSPSEYLRELETARLKSGGPTQEFYDQLELGVSPFELYRRLRSARRVRHLAASVLLDWQRAGSTKISVGSIVSAMNVEQRDSSCVETVGLPLGHRPIWRLHKGHSASPIIDEAAFLYEWFQALSEPGAPHMQLGLALYFNMLVLTQVLRISVQQIDEVGFDQFQKYTLVGVRERLERVYEARFRQLNGSAPHRTLKHLEGRLAPKKDVRSLLDLIGSIVDGYLRFRGCPKRAAAMGLRGDAPPCMIGECVGNCRGAKSGRPDAELSLVVHFIKRRSVRAGKRVPQACDMTLRADLRQQAQVVRQAIERHSFVRQLLRGMDAASNELHTPPEVFAPTFRYLRRHGLQRATFHVGEDFVHLVSGIRACAEARAFLPLEAGDRMGHATALGILPELWIARTGPRMMIRAGEHLDNLVYAHSRLASILDSASEAKSLEEQISLFSATIYDREYSPAALYRAWLLRGLDVLEVLEIERNSEGPIDASRIANAAADKSGRLNSTARRAELALIAKAATEDPLAYEVFRQRHSRSDRLDQLVEVRVDWLTESALTALQADVLADLSSSGVAIETLPTSNVRISAYDRLSEHHLFRWLGLGKDAFSIVPAICVGSDDTGIFATSLRNEYAAILDVLRRDFSIGSEQAAAIVEQLNRNGAAYRFRPTGPQP